jgi:type IV secretory pathway VirB6-like protein
VGSGAGSWWNPATWLQNVAGFFHGAYDAGGAILNVLGGALTILTQFFRFFFDTGHFIADAVNWLTSTLFPPELQTWFLGTIGEPGQQWNSAQIYEALYKGMIPPALMIAAVAAAGRIIRALVDHRTSSMETILAVLPRFLLAVAVIGIPGTQVSVGYTAIVWCVDASIAISGAVIGLILHASLLSGAQPGQGWFSHVYGVLTHASNDMVAVVIGGIPLLILILYAAFLMIVRTVMLGFCIVAAPLCLATAVFDSNNRFFHWWLDLLGSVLLTPLVLGMAIALSLTLASHVVSAAVVGPLLAVVVICGAAAAYWLEHADVLVLPSAASKQDFNGVLDYLDVRDLPPVIVASLVPRTRRNREHPLTKRYLTAIAQRVYRVVDVPDDAERVRYAGMQGVPVEAVSSSLRAAYRELADAIVRAPQAIRA